MITSSKSSKKRAARVRAAVRIEKAGSGDLANLVRSRMTVVDRNGQLRRWGNSPATHITQRILIAAGVDESQSFDTLASNGVVTLVFHAEKNRKTKRSPYERYTLDDLLPVPMKPGRKESWPGDLPRGKESW
jgi:antitoxin component of MazEF toxin-antitoxin module